MKKTGIVLAFAPEQKINNHGIGRLTAFIISAIINNGCEVAIAVPAWYKQLMLEFLAEHRIDTNKVQLITTDGVPCLLRIRSFILGLFKRCKTVKGNPVASRVYKKLKNFNLNLVFVGLASSSIVGFTLLNSISFLFLFPFILMGLVALIAFRSFDQIVKTIKPKIKKRVNLRLSYLNFIVGPLSVFRRNILVYRIYKEIRKVELAKLVHKINQCDDVETWFVPALFWPEIVGIKAKKIVAAPDIVFLDFPLLFASSFYGLVSQQISKTIDAADHLICYSNYVKSSHLMKGYGVSDSKVSVIKHGNIDLSKFLTSVKNADSMKYDAQNILRSYQRSHLHGRPYLRDFDLGNMKYIFYSSQIRPYKNFLSLIKAYEILLRKKFINIKLITTANLEEDREMWSYIANKRLQYDILSFTNVSSEVLAALNHLAICAVNPTLFEGGFPFTFTEAYSVGTPSVMSAIPVVLDEVVDPALQARMLFDPYNVDDMVDKISWAVENRTELLRLEAPLYQKMESRTWEIVANEYVEVFNSVESGQYEMFV